MLRFLEQIGNASVLPFWVPVLAWTALAGVATLWLVLVARNLHPLGGYRLRQALLLALPASILIAPWLPELPIAAGGGPALAPAFATSTSSADPGPAGSSGIDGTLVSTDAGSRADTVDVADIDTIAALLGIVMMTLASLALVRLSMLAAATWRLHQLGRAAPRAEDPLASGLLRELARQCRVRRPVELRNGPPGCIPMTFGVWRPVVVVPPELPKSPDSLKTVLMHELIHVRRGDHVWALLDCLTAAAFAFHPLVWLLRRGIQRCRETSCDAEVVSAGKVSRHEYAQLLVRTHTANRMVTEPLTASMFAQPSLLKQRLESIRVFGNSRRPLQRSGDSILASVCLFSGLALVGGSTAVQDVAPVREAREVMRLGDAVDVPDWLTFASEPRLMPDASGRLFVVPGGDPRIRVLSPAGEFVRYIGNRGTGPGEFSFLYRAGFAEDTLWIQDRFASRTSFFDADGTHIRTEANTGRPEIGSGYTTRMPLAASRQLVVGPAAEVAAGQRARMAVAIGPRGGSRLDTVASIFENASMEIEGIDGTFAHQPVRVPPLYARLPDGSGLVVVDWAIDLPDRVAVRRYGLSGQLTSESTLDFELQEIPTDVREGYIEEGIAMVKRTAESLPETVGQQVPSDLRGAVIRGTIIPDYYPPVATLFVTHEGRVWLRLTTSAEDDGSEWIVVGPDGAPEFRITAPPDVTFKAAHGDRVWGTGKTELDIPYIVLYELGPARGG